jgi:hypothetical protein
MDSFSLTSILEITSKFGLVGLLICLWWYDARRMEKSEKQHTDDLKLVLDRYQKDMTEQREMYKNNASLCKDFSNIATDLREIVIMNIEKMTRVEEAVRQNQFCPMQRVEKKQIVVGRES